MLTDVENMVMSINRGAHYRPQNTIVRIWEGIQNVTPLPPRFPRASQNLFLRACTCRRSLILVHASFRGHRNFFGGVCHVGGNADCGNRIVEATYAISLYLTFV